MKITVDRKQLERELSIAKKIIGKGNNLAICYSVMVAFYQDGIAITSTDLGRSYTGIIGDRLHNYWIPDNADRVCISLEMFMRIVKAISKKTTEISLEIAWDGGGLLVNDTTTIISLKPEDYPELPKFPSATQHNLFTYEGLSQVGALKGHSDDRRAHIQCLYVDTENGRIASTDGSRLYTSKIPTVENITPFLIDKNAIGVLCTPQLKNNIGSVRVKDNNVFIDTGNGFMSIHICEGEFPDCGFLIEMFGQEPEVVVSMPDKQIIIDAMNESQGILNDQYKGITIDINSRVVVSAVNPDSGEFSKDISSDTDTYMIENNLIDYELLECTSQLQNHIGYISKPLSLALNPAYVIDACKQIPDSGLNLLFPGENSPMLIESAETDFKAIIMPMRI